MGLFTGNRGETDTRELRIDETITAIEVDADAATVEVTAASGDTTSVDVVLKAGVGGTLPSFEHSVDGGVLKLEVQLPARAVDARAELSIAAPRAATLALKVRAGKVLVAGRDGAVRFDGAAAKAELRDIAGDVTLDVDAGSVSGSDLRGDRLTVESAAGKVDLDALRCRNVTVVADAGKVDLELLERPASVDVRASVGAVGIDLPAGSYNLTTTATLGKVAVRDVINDPASDSKITAEASVGKISITGRT